jgi:peptide deformylase
VTLRTILRFPDHRLRANAERVVLFDEDLCSLATDLLDTLRAASAIGITAAHIGVLKRLVVIELAAADGVRTYVNPEIVWASADMSGPLRLGRLPGNIVVERVHLSPVTREPHMNPAKPVRSTP